MSSAAETCTTGPFDSDEDPLLCPHGYFCFVDSDKKNNKKKKSTTGHCVKQEADHYSPGDTQMALTAALRGRSICHVDGIVLLDGATLRLTDKKCQCKKGFLSCVDNKSRSERVDMKVRSKKPDGGKDRKDKQRRRRRKNRKSKGANRS